MIEITNNPGIYAIKNPINNKIYVGSTVNLRDRKCAHFRQLLLGIHPNPYLQADYNKHNGIETYEFSVLELVEDVNFLLKREQFYIDQYFDNQDKCFNICKIAGSQLGMKHTEESKKKTSLALKGRKISPNTLARLLDKERNPFAKSGAEHPKTGKVMPDSAREAIRKALTGKEKTEEHLRHISEALKGKTLNPSAIKKFRDGRRKGTNNAHAKKVIQLDLQGNIIKIWDLMSSASKETETNLASMSACCHGHNKAANGFVWRLVDAVKTNDLVGV